MKKMIVTSLFLIFMTGVIEAQTDNDYKATLKKMLEVSGSEETFKTVIKQMVTMFKQQKTEVPENIWNEFEKEFSTTTLDDLVDMLIPVYKRHLTQEDLQKIIEFYATPTGQKYAEKTPLITQESMEVGQVWGMKVGQKFIEKLKAKGY